MVLHLRANRRERAAQRAARQRPDDGVTYKSSKGSLIGKDSGITTVEQAERAVAVLLGRVSDAPSNTTAPNS